MSCAPVGWGCRIHRLLLCRGVRHLLTSVIRLNWLGCRIHRLLLCRGVRHLLTSVLRLNWLVCRIHRLLLCRGVRHLLTSVLRVSWLGCRIHRLLLCRGVRHPQRVSWAQLAATVENTYCFSVQGWDTPNNCPVTQLAGAAGYTDCFTAKG